MVLAAAALEEDDSVPPPPPPPPARASDISCLTSKMVEVFLTRMKKVAFFLLQRTYLCVPAGSS